MVDCANIPAPEPLAIMHTYTSPQLFSGRESFLDRMGGSAMRHTGKQTRGAVGCHDDLQCSPIETASTWAACRECSEAQRAEGVSELLEGMALASSIVELLLSTLMCDFVQLDYLPMADPSAVNTMRETSATTR